MAEEGKNTFYETLGVAVDATKAEIKKAFKRKASKHHPDRDGGDKDKFQKIQTAYAVLCDDRKRQKYDTDGEEGGEHVLTPRESAYQNLSMLFTGIVSENMDCIETIDIIKTIEANIKKNRKAPESIIKKMDKRLIKIKKAISKLKRKVKKPGTPDLFEHILGMQQQDAERNISNAREQLEMMDIMVELTNEYEYDFDKVDPLYEEDRFDPRQSGVTQRRIAEGLMGGRY
jgi:curved DNA-binding protein CbpA